MLDPNRVIGAPYFMRTINLLNQRVESGVLHAEDDQSITLKGENGILKQILKKDIDEIQVQEKSLMPEGLTKDMKEQDFRDLVRYVMANPFVTNVEVYATPKEGKSVKTSPAVGVNGRISLPDGDQPQVVVSATVIAPADMTVRLLVGSKSQYIANVNGPNSKSAVLSQVSGKGSDRPAQPDQSSVELKLAKGENRLIIVLQYNGKGEALFLRFHDPDRKLRYVEK